MERRICEAKEGLHRDPRSHINRCRILHQSFCAIVPKAAGVNRDHPQVNKADVISQSNAGVNDKILISMLTISHSRFDLKSEDVVDVKNARVSEKMIDAMIDERSSSAGSTPQTHRRYYSFEPN